MFNRVKNAFYNAVTSLDSLSVDDQANLDKKRTKFPYSRPSFLQWNTNDEVLVSADHAIRPIIVPRDISKIPWNVGYAETINAGKSTRNEDQASIQVVTLRRDSTTEHTLFYPESEIKSQINNSGFTLFKSNGSHSNENIIPNDNLSVTATESHNISVKDEADEGNVSSTSGIYQTPPSTPNSKSCDVTNNETDSSRLISKYASCTDSKCTITKCLPYFYFGVFDGHAGSGAAVVASNELHRIIQEKLVSVIEFLIPSDDENDLGPSAETASKSMSVSWSLEKEVSTESLVIGALEAAFVEMDDIIAADRFKYKITGGCTSLVALFIFGKLFVANAGDSRAVLCKNNVASPMSYDFTPETERARIRYLAKRQPYLLGDDFTQVEFVRRPLRKDIGKKLLYRDAMMSGWAYKTITPEDLKFPLVYGEGKRSRVLATIGVTRGFGDHDLRAQHSDVLIKPFLSPQPEVDTTWSKALASAEIMKNSDGEKCKIATDLLANANVLIATPPSHARFHRQCCQKFTDKRKLEQAQRKRKIPQDSDKTKSEDEFQPLCLQ
ncbi:Protein phosphatase 1H [Nymphon striatum]|nr:Protein phosphatase 1H [Nymphon striatum]KAG1712243.1 Protein phosphatase 1H [Nymphon striatum]